MGGQRIKQLVVSTETTFATTGLLRRCAFERRWKWRPRSEWCRLDWAAGYVSRSRSTRRRRRIATTTGLRCLRATSRAQAPGHQTLTVCWRSVAAEAGGPAASGGPVSLARSTRGSAGCAYAEQLACVGVSRRASDTNSGGMDGIGAEPARGRWPPRHQAPPRLRTAACARHTPQHSNAFSVEDRF